MKRVEPKQDILCQTRDVLEEYKDMTENAIQIISNTASNLEAINQSISKRAQDIVEYIDGLERVRLGLNGTIGKNEQIINSIKNFIGEDRVDGGSN